MALPPWALKVPPEARHLARAPAPPRPAVAAPRAAPPPAPPAPAAPRRQPTQREQNRIDARRIFARLAELDADTPIAEPSALEQYLFGEPVMRRWRAEERARLADQDRLRVVARQARADADTLERAFSGAPPRGR